MGDAGTNYASVQFDGVNRQFYAASPAAYFRRRLYSLLMAGGANAQLVDLLREGVTFEGLRAYLDTVEDIHNFESELVPYLSTEAEALLHHAAEALFRLYFAHADLPECPWLKCAQLRSFAKFKGQVAAMQDAPKSETELTDERRRVAEVFIGHMPTDDESELLEGLDTIIRLLRLLARRLLSDSNLYNAAKHGLAVIAGESSVSFSDEDGDFVFGGGGASLAYLEIKGHDSAKRWAITTQWVDTRQTLWLITFIIAQMRSLWTVARSRYIGAKIDGVNIVTKEALESALKGNGTRRPAIQRLSMDLGWWQQSS